MPDPSTVTRAGDRSVVVTRRFDAPRALIWSAFTSPDVLTRWLLGPPGWDMQLCEVDVTVGGTYRWRWRNAALAEEFGFTGTYTDVVRGERLADHQSFDLGSQATPMGDPTTNLVEFKDVDGGTQVTSRITYPNPQTMEAVLAQGMAEGMEMSYRGLDRLLPELA